MSSDIPRSFPQIMTDDTYMVKKTDHFHVPMVGYKKHPQKTNLISVGSEPVFDDQPDFLTIFQTTDKRVRVLEMPVSEKITQLK